MANSARYRLLVCCVCLLSVVLLASCDTTAVSAFPIRPAPTHDAPTVTPAAGSTTTPSGTVCVSTCTPTATFTPQRPSASVTPDPTGSSTSVAPYKCSLNIYPQPTPGTHRYTVTLTNNTSKPGYSMINNYWVDGQAAGNPSNVTTSNYNYWGFSWGLGYAVHGIAGIPLANGSSVTYQTDLTVGTAFDGVDIVLESQSDTSYDVCSQGHGSYTISFNNLSSVPTATPTPATPPAPTPSSCSLNIYPQPTPGTHHYTVTLTNNTGIPGYNFVDNFWVDGGPSGHPKNVSTTSNWFVHAPTLDSSYTVTGTAGTPLTTSLTYQTDLTFSSTFDGVDVGLQSQGNGHYDICGQSHSSYSVTFANLP